MTEVEALKRFIPILGRICPPGERVIVTRNILERIAGKRTDSVMGVSHKYAGALAWPNDTTKAGEFESVMDNAVDAGEFVSWAHKVDRRHLQIEELASWPGCPAIAPDSPLVFWLGEPAPAQTATPAPVVAVGDGPEPLTKAPAWSLITSLGRAPGYRWPLYQFLKAAHAAGKPCPKARDVLDAWMLKPPPDVQAMPDGVKYNNSLGNPKEANLKAIQQAIKALLQNEAGQAPPKRRTR